MKGITFTYESKDGRNGRTFTGAKGMIESQLLLLQGYRDDGRVPSKELLWEIRLYEFILAQPDPEKAAEAYFAARWKDDKYHDKREVAKILEWEVP